jgi:hypothetical protein
MRVAVFSAEPLIVGFGSWNIPQSTRTRACSVSSRKQEPVTCRSPRLTAAWASDSSAIVHNPHWTRLLELSRAVAPVAPPVPQDTPAHVIRAARPSEDTLIAETGR